MDLISPTESKEFVRLYNPRVQPVVDSDIKIAEHALNIKNLRLNSYQHIARVLMGPESVRRSLFMFYPTGVGKSLSTVVMAMEWVKLFREKYRSTIKNANIMGNVVSIETPVVIYLGFKPTKTAIYKELLHYPEFGFISLNEREELIARKKASSQSPQHMESYVQFFNRIKKRIVNPASGGFFSFYGYQEFVNRLFYVGAKAPADYQVNLAALYMNALSTGANFTELVDREIASGRLSKNEPLFRQLENSVIVCDEFHNTYNSIGKNNYGCAIEYIIDTVSTLRALYVTASPIKTPGEICDVANYILPIGKKISRQDLFQNGKLKPGSLDVIDSIFAGYVLYVQDRSVDLYPERILRGETIKFTSPVFGHDSIPYLKFKKCKLSPGQLTVMKTLLTEESVTAVEQSRLPTDIADLDDIDEEVAYKGTVYEKYKILQSETVSDIVFPLSTSAASTEVTGRHLEAKNKISDISRSEQSHYVKIIQNDKLSIIAGDWLKRENLAAYSGKYVEMLNLLDEIIKSAEVGKIMIYHDAVQGSGAMLISEILRTNGFIEGNSEPTLETKCRICGGLFGKHDNALATNHQFSAARFLTIHSYQLAAESDNIFQTFISPYNAHGEKALILVGSKIIKEGYDFKSIRHLVIASAKGFIPVLLQIYGRAVRKNSHIELPLDQRNVNIHSLITTGGADLLSINPEFVASPEELKMLMRLIDYAESGVQPIERVLYARSIDAHINSTEGPTEADLNLLPFTPSNKRPNWLSQSGTINVSAVTSSTFNANRYYESEMKTHIYSIRRLFQLKPYYTYEELWDAIKRKVIPNEYAPELFSEEIFAMALDFLIKDRIDGGTNDMLIDAPDRRIFKNSTAHLITQIGEYLVAVPTVSGRLIVDIETWNRPPRESQIFKPINITKIAANANKKEIINVANKFFKEWKSPVEEFLLAYNDVTQRQVLDIIIETLHKDGKYSQLSKQIIELFKSLTVIVTVKDVINRRDVFKQTAAGFDEKIDHSYPAGYIMKTGVRIFDRNKLAGAVAGDWFFVSLESMGFTTIYKENTIIMGYLVVTSGQITLKLKSVGKVAKSKDARKVDRGVICQTKNKEKLASIVSRLSITGIKNRIKSACDMIFLELLAREVEERKKHTDVKWLYGWWNK
jgi:hypothetical protein